VTLGRVALLDDAGPGLPGPGKPLALLTYLRAIPGQTATREHLVDLLWADSDPTLGRQALRQILLRLRQALGEHTIPPERNEVTLAVPLWHDRDCFLGHIASGDLVRAVEAYTGTFFPGFATTGSIEFEHWVDAERAHLQGLYLRAGETLVRRRLDDDPRDALRVARVLHREAPESEAIWRLLLQSLLASGDVLQAHAEADALERWLADAARGPEPATAALVRVVRQEGATVEVDSPGLGQIAELVGREREFAEVLTNWKAVSQGASRFLHFEAPAGLGKSRLLRDTRMRLRSMGVTALQIAVHQGEQEMSFSLAAGTVRLLADLPGVTGISPALAGPLLGLHPPLASLFPGAAAPAVGADLLHQRSAALAELLSAVSDERPLALFIDDLHWADHASRQVLAGAANRIGTARVLLVTAARPGATGGPLFPAAPVHRLEPLTEAECEALMAGLAAVPDGDWSRRLATALWRASHGAPLLAVEALQLALERGDLVIAQGEWHSEDRAAAVSRLSEGDPLAARLASLSAPERRLLVALAVAATPLSLDLLEMATGAPGQLAPLLSGLETRGYVARTGEGWTAGHDEIAAAVLRGVAEDEHRELATELGRACLTCAGDDRASLHRALRFLAIGGDEASLAVALHRTLTLARAHGDTRSAAVVASELLHASAESERVRRLVRALPFGLRFGLGRRTVAAALGGLALLTLVALRPWRQAPLSPDVELLVARASPPGATILTSVPLRLAEWDRTHAINPSSGADLTIRTGERRYDRFAVAPDGKRVAFTRITGDTGLTDIFLQEADGTLRRLTNSPGDDVQPNWSPDGRFLVFSTARWTPRDDADADLGILDVATGQVRQLTHGPDIDRTPAWSPDGSRIAFIRHLESGDGQELCWVTFAGAGPYCRDDPGATYMTLAGWEGPSRVLAVRRGDSTRASQALVGVELDGSGLDVIDARPTSDATVSGDGKWILAIQTDDDAGRSWLRAFPTHFPDLARTVYPEDDLTIVYGSVWRPSVTDSRRYLDTLRVVAPVAMPVTGLPHGLRIEGRSADGRLVRLPAAVVRWTVSDPTVAVVDSVTGVLTPLRPGTVRVLVTAGGWRSASIALRVERASAQPLDSIRWTDAEWAGWTRFGTPSPRTESLGSGGSVLLPNGDETFESGVVSPRRYAVLGGLGIEARLNLPIERTKWQQLKMAIGTNTVALRDGVTFTNYCTLDFPSGEGAANLNQMQFTAGGGYSVATGLQRLRDGQWHRLRIEVLTDGSCAYSADGRPLWRSTSGFSAGDSVELIFYGHSVGTRIMVGAVDLWRGVKARQ